MKKVKKVVRKKPKKDHPWKMRDVRGWLRGDDKTTARIND